MDFDQNSPFAALIPQFDAIVDQIKTIDSTLAGLAGTHAARKAEALAKLTANEDPSVLAFNVTLEALEAAKSAHEDAREALNEAVSAALREDKSANTTERDAHLATRDSLVTAATSMATLIAGATKPVTASDLGIAKPKGVGSSGTPRTAKVGQGVFSYRRDGDAEYTTPCDSQQSLSSIAYRVFDRAPVGVLREALAATNGGPVDETKPFALAATVNGKTATVVFSVVAEGGEG